MTVPGVGAARSRLASMAVAAALLGGVAAPAVVLAPVAAAHSVILSVDPEDGATVDRAPEQVVLTFNEDINQSFASVAVTSDADRADKVAREPAVDGATVTVDLDGVEPGAYTVGYRVTSADGHVVSGSSTFTVEGAGGTTTTTPAAAASGSADGADEAGSDEAGADEAGDSSGVNPALWVVGGAAVLLIGGAFFVLRRGS